MRKPFTATFVEQAMRQIKGAPGTPEFAKAAQSVVLGGVVLGAAELAVRGVWWLFKSDDEPEEAEVEPRFEFPIMPPALPPPPRTPPDPRLDRERRAARHLGVSIDATVCEIRTAYRSKARLVHPDLNPDHGPARMQAANDARDVLLARASRAS